jgi:hypothetical protein
VVEPSAGRQVWLPLNARIQAITWSDIISGFALLYFGRRSLSLIARLASGSAAVSSVFG